jgi:hypothetical protein
MSVEFQMTHAALLPLAGEGGQQDRMRVRLFAKSRTLAPTSLPHAGERLNPKEFPWA